jgi:hypothetical protein
MGSSTPLPRRLLGPGGPQVPVLALGSWNTWDRMGFDDAVALVSRAVALGCGSPGGG